MSVASHIDMAIKQRIKEGQYVNFAKLIPKDKVLTEDDNRVQYIMKGGGTFFVPASESPSSTAITSVTKWDQAFHVYSDIYCHFNPTQSTELIQYSHVIHTAASSYVWDNVYAYDRDFCLHMAVNVGQTWAIILQQAWSMRLRDRIRFNDSGRNGQNNSPGNNNSYHLKDHCKQYNRGRCIFGSQCRYDHHCSYCGKYGHGPYNCHKYAAENKRDKEEV